MNKLNVIWILGEGLRNYLGNDRHSKYKIIDKLSSEGIMFNNLVVSAPSTVMNQSSMMTSQPSIFLNRTYADFEFDKTYFTSLSRILKEHNYSIYTTTYWAEGRHLLKEIMLPLEQKDLPSNLKNDNNWKSENFNQILDVLLEKGLNEPFFLLLNYNNQEDTDKFIELAIKRLKDEGLYNSSLFVFCPDHGWNDNNRNKIMKRHDLILTDSNILVHCFIHYPHCLKKKIDTLASTIDILPTILDILEIPTNNYNLKGKSLLPLIEKNVLPEEKIFRTDLRHLFQSGRAISLKNKKFKYLYYFDSKREEFYDLVLDPNEKENLINSPKYAPQIDEFRVQFKQKEKELIDFNSNYLSYKFSKNMAKFQKVKKILMIGSSNNLFIKMLLTASNNTFSEYELDVIVDKDIGYSKFIHSIPQLKGKINFHYMPFKKKKFCWMPNFQHKDDGRIDNREFINYKTLNFTDFITHHNTKILTTNYELVIIPLNNPYGVGHKELSKIAKKIKSKNVIYIDYNTNFKKPTNWFLEGLHLINAKKNYYMRNPKRLLLEVRRYLKEVKNK